MQNIQFVFAAVLLISGVLFFGSLVFYFPLYMYLLKNRAPDLYHKYGGLGFSVAPQVLTNHIYFFCTRKYLSANDKLLTFHGTILTWVLGYAGFVNMSTFVIWIIYLYLAE